jgi:AcrR family transcriptional regulator
LTVSDVSTTSTISATHGSVWVWPFESGESLGLRISPLHENLSQVFKTRSEWADFFSCLEILRFRDHPLIPKARERVEQWLRERFKVASPSPRPTGPAEDPLVGDAARLIAETGYRALSLEQLGERLGVPVLELEARFHDKAGLAAEIARAAQARAGAHFGKMLMARPENRLKEARESLASFFNFLDTNEDYFRLGAWYYVERMSDTAPNSGVLTEAFFQGLEDFFSTIPSSRSPQARAAMFANGWLSYAWFRWFEFPKMPDRKKAEARLRALGEVLVDALA